MDGDEWLHHRKIMNQIFLSRDIEAVTLQPIETASSELINRWTQQLATSKDSSVVVSNLEGDMYKLSIESKNLLKTVP